MSLCLAGRSSSLASIQRFLSCFAREGPGDSCSDLGSLDQFRSVNVIDPNMSHMWVHCGSSSTVRFKSHQSRAMDAMLSNLFILSCTSRGWWEHHIWIYSQKWREYGWKVSTTHFDQSCKVDAEVDAEKAGQVSLHNWEQAMMAVV